MTPVSELSLVASAFGIYFNWNLRIYHALFGMTSPGQCHETLIPAQWQQDLELVVGYGLQTYRYLTCHSALRGF